MDLNPIWEGCDSILLRREVPEKIQRQAEGDEQNGRREKDAQHGSVLLLFLPLFLPVGEIGQKQAQEGE